MKAITVFVTGLIFSTCAGAQTQEIQQLKLNLEKLVQLKLMLSQMKQGYQTLQNGYNNVRDAAKGNFNLHKNYLDGLLAVSDKVRNSPSLRQVLINQTLVKSEFRDWYGRITGLGVFTRPELSGIQSSYHSIADAADADLAQLNLVITDGALRMSDGERLAAMESLSLSSDQQLASVRTLIKEQTAIAVTKAQVKKDMQALRLLHGLQ